MEMYERENPHTALKKWQDESIYRLLSTGMQYAKESLHTLGVFKVAYLS